MNKINCHGCNVEIIKKTPKQKWCLSCSYNQCKPTSNRDLSKKECPLCHVEFIPINHQSIYCSKDCIKIHKNISINDKWSKETIKSKKVKPIIFGHQGSILI